MATARPTAIFGKRFAFNLNGDASRPTATMASEPIATDSRSMRHGETSATPSCEMVTNRPTPDPASRLHGARASIQHGESEIGHGSVLIAAITSCTNTSNPSVMLAAGLLAKKAVERGLRVDPVGEDFARARLARRHRLSEQDRPADRISISSASTSSATAARPASATPARSHPRSKKAINEERSGRRVGAFAATATSKRASIRTSRRTS